MSLRCLTLVAICVVFISTEAVSGEDVKKSLGDEVSFRPDKVVPPVTSITWKQINGVNVVKVIEWDEDGVSIPNPRFKGITTLDNKTGEINITNLKVEHSGLYTIDINSKEQQLRFTLTVMERVPKPEITIEKSSNTDVVYLRCGYNETIIWKNSTGHTLKGTKNHNPGEFITVENTRNPDNFYTCTLKNAVSEETSDRVYERDMFGTGEDVKKAVGGKVSFRLPKLESPVTSFTWKQINGGTVKAIEWDEDGVIIPNPRFKDITTLDEKTGEITITNLKVEHSGIYTIDINSKEQQLRFSLTVMERVPKPEITIEKSNNTDVV